MKSPAIELALREVRRRQKLMMAEHRGAMADYEIEREWYDREKAQWKRRRPGDLTDPPHAPEPPVCQRCWTDDVTIEALALLLQQNPRGMLAIRDELAGWLHFDRYTAGGGRGSEVAKWLEMHGGRFIVVDRKTTGTIFVPRAAVSIIGGIQPEVLRRALGQEHRDNGLAARLLLTMPPRRAKRWSEADVEPELEEQIAALFERLYGLEPDRDADGEPRPAIVSLTAGGKRAWQRFSNEHADEQVELTSDLAAAWSKLEGYAARLALVHHLLRWVACDPTLADADAIDESSIAAGIRLSRWFGGEARRVYAMLAEDDDDRETRRLVELIDRKGGSVTVREWHRARSHRSAADAEAELALLEQAGVGQWQTAGPTPKGGRPSKRFVLYAGPMPAGATDRTSMPPLPIARIEPPGGVVSVLSVSEPLQDDPDTKVRIALDPTGVPTPRQEAARLIRLVHQRDRVEHTHLATAMREAWHERLAICLADGGLSPDQAEQVALEELRNLLPLCAG